MLLFFIFSYIQVYNVTSTEYYFVANSLDFRENALFNIEIQSGNNCSLIVGFLTFENLIRIQPVLDLVNGPIQCSKGLQYYGFYPSFLMKFDKNMTQKHTEIISITQSLLPIILSCTDSNQSTHQETQNYVINETEFRSNYLLTINVTNPPTYSEAHQALFLIAPQIILFLYCFIFLLWMINWIMYFKLTNFFHLYFSFTFLITLVYMIIYTLEYKAIGQSPSTKRLTDAATSMRLLAQLLIMSCIYISLFCSGKIFLRKAGFEKYIFGYINVLYVIPGLFVHLKWEEHSLTWMVFCWIFIFVKLLEFLAFHYFTFYAPVGTVPIDGLLQVYYIYYITIFYIFLIFLFDFHSRYVLETALNCMVLLVMTIFFYYFKLSPFNRYDYWDLHHVDEIEIVRDHSDESDVKPPKNWQKETEEIR